MKRALKILLITVGGLIGLLLTTLIALAIWVTFYPAHAWSVAEKYLLPEDLKVKWEELDFSAVRETWRSWQLEVDVKGLTVNKASPEVEVSFVRLHFDFGLKLWTAERWFEFRRFEVLGGQPFRVKLEPSSEPGPEQSPYQMARGYLGYLNSAGQVSSVESLNVVLPAIRVESGESPALDLRAVVTKEPGEKVNVYAEVRRDTLEVLLNTRLDTENAPLLAGNLNLRAGQVRADTKFKLSSDDEVISLEGQVDARVPAGEKAKPVKLDPKFTLTMQESGAELNSGMRVTGIPGPLVELEKVSVKLNMPFTNDRMWSSEATSFRVWSMVELFFIDRDMRPPIEKACRCKIPETLEASVAGEAWLANYFEGGKERKLITDTRIKVESVRNRLFTADIGARMKVSREGEAWVLDPELDTELIIESFQGIRQFLDARGVMIPAPLDVLDGKLHLTAKGAVEQPKDRYRSEAHLKVDLKSPDQRVDVDTRLTFDLDSKLRDMDVFVATQVAQLRLQLPPLDPIFGIPPVTPDKRVELQPTVKPKKKSGFRTRLYLEVETAAPGSIQLLSELAKPHIPVSLNIKTSEAKGTVGHLKLEPFTLSYLRRNVAVENLRLDLEGKEEEGAIPVSGKFHVDQTDYRVFIEVAGSVQSPNIEMYSEPSLPRNEIISVLLYDRTSSELVSSEDETVGGFEAAIADRAIGLFGLWAFASTPIRSFSYNPVTKVYTATVQLGGGVTAGVGTTWEQAAHLELRKRVSRRWVLTATWNPSSETAQPGQLVLQWERRF